MRTFIINLKDNTTRRNAMQTQLDKTSLNYQFIEAVNGASLSDSELKKRVADYPDCMLTKGEIGCALSHLKIYQKIADEKIDHALILEDDAVIPEDITETVNQLVQLDNNHCNVYLLSAVNRYIKNKKSHSRVCKVYDADGTHGYLINQQAAKKLLSVLNPVRYEADMWQVFRFNNYINVYCLIPHIINNNDTTKFSSLLEQERVKNREKREAYRAAMRKKERFYQFYRIKELLAKKFFFEIEEYQG